MWIIVKDFYDGWMAGAVSGSSSSAKLGLLPSRFNFKTFLAYFYLKISKMEVFHIITNFFLSQVSTALLKWAVSQHFLPLSKNCSLSFFRILIVLTNPVYCNYFWLKSNILSVCLIYPSLYFIYNKYL